MEVDKEEMLATIKRVKENKKEREIHYRDFSIGDCIIKDIPCMIGDNFDMFAMNGKTFDKVNEIIKDAKFRGLSGEIKFTEK